ncbi:MAG: hypothetical protein LC791_04975 [Acidobacteria bacterium]|nr:hypothetical protein [Acidobacteriota bacterium]
MIRQSQRLLAAVAMAGLTAVAVAFAEQDAPRKLIAPVRGEATIEMTPPATKVVGTEVVTTIIVKNTSSGAIAGFKIEENWYDKGGNPIGGDTYRHPRPLPPNEIITITLKTPRHPQMTRNQYQFSHANGNVKPKSVPKIEVPKTS